MGPDTGTPEERDSSEPGIDVQLGPGRERGFAAVVSLRGDQDLASASDVAATLAELDGNVLIDLTWCTFIDSTVIGVLFARNGELERAGRYLEVVVPRENNNIWRTLELVRMRDVIVVHEVRPSLDADSPTGT